jgi:hypothetical protein
LHYFLKVIYVGHCKVGSKLFIPYTLLPTFLVKITPGIAAHPATALGGRIHMPAQCDRIALPAFADRLIESTGFFQLLQMMTPAAAIQVFHALLIKIVKFDFELDCIS